VNIVLIMIGKDQQLVVPSLVVPKDDVIGLKRYNLTPYGLTSLPGEAPTEHFKILSELERSR
jgi:hypothetical protein